MKNKAHFSQGMLLFRLSPRQTFAIGTLKVREIVQFTRLTSLPRSHPSVLGITNIRGKSLPIVDMAAAIGYQPLSKEELNDCQIIITDCQRKEIGFLVRGIEKIVECNWKDIIPPNQNLGTKAFLTGVFKTDNRIIQVLDVELLFALVFANTENQQKAILTDVQREKLKPLSILIVDDSMVARKQLSDVLQHFNIPFVVTDNGQKALDIMQRSAKEGKPIDLLVSDIEMPGLDGYELAFAVRDNKLTAQAYIILHTSLSSEISVGQAKQVGADEALTKFNAIELVDAMLRGAESKQK